MKNTKEKYGLLTAITMIVGICIGSGIFFKSDNILISTNGSIFLGVLVFALAALSIIFGGLCLSQLASRTDKAGGAITYFEEFGSKKLACGFGWFQIFVYYPTITAVVSWVVGIYVSILFNLNLNLMQQVLIGFAFCTLCFLYNIFSPKFGGYFQNATTVIKLIPLFLIGVLGFMYGDPIAGLANTTPQTFTGSLWITAVAPIAFSYDGWIIATSIQHEVKDSKRNMPLALVIGPIFILLIYVLYFVGVSSLVTPEKVMELGDKHVELAATTFFGPMAAKAVIVFVTISVMGTVNGLVLGFIRIPYALSLRGNVIMMSDKLKVENGKWDMPINSAIFAYALVAFWMIVHLLTTQFHLLPNSDISEISIAISYVMYIIMYYKVFGLYRKREIKSVWAGVICPLLATIGALFIVSGSMTNKLFYFYATFCILVFFSAFVYFKRNEEV